MRVRTFVPFITRRPSFPPAAYTRALRTLGLQRGPPHSRSFRQKGGWKIAGNFGNALALPTPSSSRLHLIKGAWSSSGLRKNFQSPRTYTRRHVHTYEYAYSRDVLSCNQLRGQITLRDAGILVPYPCLLLARTCRTLDYSTMTLTIFHSLSISARLNLHLAKSVNHPVVQSVFRFVNLSRIRCFPVRKYILPDWN